MMIRAHRRGVAGFPTLTQERLATALSRNAPGSELARDFERAASAAPTLAPVATPTAPGAVAPSAGAAIDTSSLESSPDYSACACAADQLALLAGTTLTPSQVTTLIAQCLLDRQAFEALLVEQGVTLEPCKPWYMRRTTWFIGGGLALAALTLSFLRRR